MTSHHAAQYSRYPHSHSLPVVPQGGESLRLPSLKDLNFSYRSPHTPQDAQSNPTPVEPAPSPQDHNARHIQQSWRPAQSSSVPQPMPTHPLQQHQQHPHQQHTPPLSAGHDSSGSKLDYPSKIDYPSKHDNGGYAHPGIPMSAQVTPIQSSVAITQQSRAEEPSPNMTKRSRPASANMNVPRDVRPSHNTYTPQYASYSQSQPPPTSPHYQQIPSTVPSNLPGPPPSHSGHNPPPPPHEQLQHHPVHAAYGGYQHPHMQSRPPQMHPHYSQHPQQQPPPTHNNPYPSPGPPPPAPPPQGPWAQTHHQQPQHHQQLPPSQGPPPPPHQPPPPQQQPQHQQQHGQHPAHIPTHHPAPSSAPPPQHTQMVQQHHHHQHQQQQQQQQQQPQAPPPQPPQHHTPHPAQPQVQQQQQHSQLPFARTTALVPTPVETRGPYPAAEPERVPSARLDTMTEVYRRCSFLYTFASRYAQAQATIPEVQPSPAELAEMSQHASTIVHLLEEYRRMNFPETERAKMNADAASTTSPDDPRPPKRPWEDISQDGAALPAESVSFSEQYAAAAPNDSGSSNNNSGSATNKTTAEQDMETIRTKRATSAAGGNGTAGQPKSKYRKRSRATPPGKCHSCNIRETPEWRRGPDGARTLCNACGLHYAKLMRKKDKAGDPNRIDMETLRASAKAAETLRASTKAADLAERIRANPKLQQQSMEPPSPMESTKPPPQQVHQSTFQLVSMMPPEPAPQPMASEQRTIPPPAAAHHSSMPAGSSIPPPPWATHPSSSTSNGRYAPDHLQHQSFVRTSQHPSTTQTSPR